MKKYVLFACVIAILLNLSLSTTFAYADDTGVYANYTGILADDTGILEKIGVLDGYGKNDLKLENDVNRAEFTKMIIAASEFRNELDEELVQHSFEDLSKEHWANPYVSIALDKGLVFGYEDGSFKADNTVRYEEALAICLRVLDHVYDTTELPWGEAQIDAASKIGLTNGVSCSAGENMKRGEVVKLLNNMLFCQTQDGNYHINSLGYRFLLAELITKDENGYILTNEGIYKTKYSVADDSIGKQGILILDEHDKAEDFISVANDDALSVSEPVVEEIYDGPYTIKSSNWAEDFNGSEPISLIVRNGKSCDADDIQINDVVYYSENANKILAFSNITAGVYQAATPNINAPKSITVSGNEYPIESVHAFNKVYANGQYKLGDAITVLLGQNGGVVDVLDVPTSQSQSTIVGYVVGTGVKKFTINGVTTQDYYATLQFPDGKKIDYITEALCDYYKNKVVSVAFNGKYATLNVVRKTFGYNGIFDYDNKTFDGNGISDNIQIMDVYSTDRHQLSLYKIIKPERINQVSISSERILYCEQNAAGKITKLILDNVTGDMLKYGILTKVSNNFETLKGEYSYDISGTGYSVKTSDKLYDVEKGVPAVFATSDGKTIETMRSLYPVSGKITSITKTSIETANETYPISEDVCVYERKFNDTGSYLTLTINDLVANKDRYNVDAYFDKSAKYGGRVRIIVVSGK